MSEIVVEGDGYWFTTDQWSRYTGRQIIIGAFVALGVALSVAGFVLTFQAVSQAIVETPDGVVLVAGGAGPGLTTGFVAATCGAFLLGFALPFWPEPWRYGQPIEERGSG